MIIPNIWGTKKWSKPSTSIMCKNETIIGIISGIYSKVTHWIVPTERNGGFFSKPRSITAYHFKRGHLKETINNLSNETDSKCRRFILFPDITFQYLQYKFNMFSPDLSSRLWGFLIRHLTP